MELGFVTPKIHIKPFERDLRPKDIQMGAGVPHFYSDSSDWQPVKMQTIQDFCQKIDYNKPDFLQILKDLDRCRFQINDIVQFNSEEKVAYEELLLEYEQSYHFIYLNVFEKNLAFKKPLIINVSESDGLLRAGNQ